MTEEEGRRWEEAKEAFGEHVLDVEFRTDAPAQVILRLDTDDSIVLEGIFRLLSVTPERCIYTFYHEDLRLVFTDREDPRYKFQHLMDSARIFSRELLRPRELDLRPYVKGLFDVIVGYEDLKDLFRRAIVERLRVSFLLIGPPASAKTLFLLEMSKLPRSALITGSSTSKAGLGDYLLENQHLQHLLIDEVDRMDREDYAALLSLMETGIVTEMKYHRTRRAQLDVLVFASANSIERIPQEVLSRFERLRFRPYTREEFMEISRGLLTKREGVGLEMAQRIGETVWDRMRTKDFREAVRLARLAKTEGELEDVVRTIQRYG